jgi:hypothetical protein
MILPKYLRDSLVIPVDGYEKGLLQSSNSTLEMRLCLIHRRLEFVKKQLIDSVTVVDQRALSRGGREHSICHWRGQP